MTRVLLLIFIGISLLWGGCLICFAGTARDSGSGGIQANILVLDTSCEELVKKKIFNVKCYGAVGDGQADDTKSLKAAIAAATKDGIVFLPQGSYLINDTLDISGIHISGVPIGDKSSTIILSEEIQSEGIQSVGVQSVLPAVLLSEGQTKIENLMIRANGKARTAIHISRTTEPFTIIRGVSALMATEYGIYLEDVASVYMKQVRVEYNEEAGIKLKNASGVIIHSLWTSGEEGYGLMVEGDYEGDYSYLEGFPKGIRVTHAFVDRNKHGVYMRDVKKESRLDSMTVNGFRHGFWFEGAENIALANSRVISTAQPIQPGSEYHAYHLTGDSSSCRLEGNLISGQTENAYSVIFIENGSVDNIIIGNHFQKKTEVRPISVVSGERHTYLSGVWGDNGDIKGLISYKDSLPKESRTWQVGDIILNPKGKTQGSYGSVCESKSDRGGCMWKELPH